MRLSALALTLGCVSALPGRPHVRPTGTAVMSSDLEAIIKANPTTTTAARPSVASSAAPASTTQPSSNGKLAFAGVNIAGFDFGCTTNGACDISKIDNIANGNGIAQMQHFVKDDGLNAFRLPVGWQYLVNNNLGGPLDATNFANYDKLVQGCISAGSKLCIIDIHNYGRWYSGIIGQSGVTNDNFISLLSQLAGKYKGTPQVAFGIMNEPHDLDINKWAVTVQLAVNAIRQAGATSNIILIPGTDYTSAGGFAPNSGPVLLGIKNPDGSTRGLIFDVHQYLDADYTGTHTSCVYNNIDGAFKPLATWLRNNKRQAMLTETGGGASDASCLQLLCQQMDYLNQNADVFLGVTTWAAGGFQPGYELLETPTLSGNTWTDQPLVSQCLVAKFRGASGSW